MLSSLSQFFVTCVYYGIAQKNPDWSPPLTCAPWYQDAHCPAPSCADLCAGTTCPSETDCLYAATCTAGVCGQQAAKPAGTACPGGQCDGAGVCGAVAPAFHDILGMASLQLSLSRNGPRLTPLSRSAPLHAQTCAPARRAPQRPTASTLRPAPPASVASRQPSPLALRARAGSAIARACVVSWLPCSPVFLDLPRMAAPSCVF